MRFGLIALVLLWFQPARERYDLLYPHFKERSAVPQANETANYAWGTSYGMLADVWVYQATRDAVYLRRALDKMANVLANRDDRRGVADYRGVSMAAWRDIHYQLRSGVTYKFGDPDNDKYAYCYVVHSGMITYPMVALAEQIKTAKPGGSYKGRSYLEWAEELIARARETVAAHDDQWTNFGSDEGYYHFRDIPRSFSWHADRNRDLPFNQSHALGQTLIVLYRLTGQRQYLDKATRLARRFKRSLAANSTGGYAWRYWQTPGVYTVSGTGEDISHATINVAFARLAYDAGIVFDSTDMQRFARTLSGTVLRQTARMLSDGCGGKIEIPDVSDTVTGGRRLNSHWSSPGRWLMVSAFDAQVYAAVARLFDYSYQTILCSGKKTHAESDLLGHAGLVLYAPDSSASPAAHQTNHH